MEYSRRKEKIVRHLTGRFQFGGILPNDGYFAGVPKHIHQRLDTANGGAGSLVVMHTFTLPANSLKNDGDYLIVWYGGDIAVNNNGKQINPRVDGQVVHSAGLFSMSGSGWAYAFLYFRVNSTTIRTCQMIHANFITRDTAAVLGGSGFYVGDSVDLTVSNLNTTDIVLDVRAQGTNATDVQQTFSNIHLVRL